MFPKIYDRRLWLLLVSFSDRIATTSLFRSWIMLFLGVPLLGYVTTDCVFPHRNNLSIFDQHWILRDRCSSSSRSPRWKLETRWVTSCGLWWPCVVSQRPHFTVDCALHHPYLLSHCQLHLHINFWSTRSCDFRHNPNGALLRRWSWLGELERRPVDLFHYSCPYERPSISQLYKRYINITKDGH